MSPSKTEVHPTYRIASIPADGIGPEVIEAGVAVLEKLASTLKTFKLEFENFDWSSDYYKKHGKYLPDDALITLKKFNAILFGAVGAPGEFPTPQINIAIY
jgi:isocitrate/isopropylmalate dehydrogenase